MIVWALGLILGISNFAKAEIIRTQMDVDYTGRVRAAPGANRIQVGGKHEVRDEEEEATLGEEADKDEDEDINKPDNKDDGNASIKYPTS